MRCWWRMRSPCSEWLARLAEGSGLGWVRCGLPSGLESFDVLLFPYGRRVGARLAFAVTAPSGTQELTPDKTAFVTAPAHGWKPRGYGALSRRVR